MFQCGQRNHQKSRSNLSVRIELGNGDTEMHKKMEQFSDLSETNPVWFSLILNLFT